MNYKTKITLITKRFINLKIKPLYMDKLKFQNIDVYLGNNELELKDESDVEIYILDQFFKGREEYQRYIDLYGQISGLEKSVILIAHGDTKDNDWIYHDKDKEYLVQEWINSVDGKYSGLLFCVCNPGTHTPKSKKSILMIPDSDVDFVGDGGVFTGRNVCFDLYVPEIGIINSYEIEHEIEKLERKLESKKRECI